MSRAIKQLLVGQKLLRVVSKKRARVLRKKGIPVWWDEDLETYVRGPVKWLEY